MDIPWFLSERLDFVRTHYDVCVFLETVDTIVSVNRRPDTQEPVLTLTYPKMEARQALIDANPAHRGIEAYRPLPQAAAE